MLHRLLLHRLFWILWIAAAARAQTPVILISIDTLRADHLGGYGYRKIRTPNIDSFAGTIFTAIDSQIPLTLPAHTVLFTSTYPFATRVEENAERVPPSVVTLASVLHSHGYQTAAFIGSSMLDRRLGLDQGFDFYDSPFQSAPSSEPENPYQVRVRRDGALVIRSAEQWLAAHRGQPVFAFVHLFDLHTPYRLSGYDAEVAYADQLLGRFKQALVRDQWWDKSLVIVLSDHGEGLEEHGESTHGYFIYESTLHVPLIVHWPAGAPTEPRQVNEPGGLIDVAPTILDFLHVPAPPSFQGASLLAGSDRVVFSESLYTADAFRWAPLRSVRAGAFKLIEAPHPELYNLDQDPGERVNLIRKNTAKAQELRVQLNRLITRFAYQGAPAPARDQSKETASKLGSLGYLAAGPSALNESGPDPKDRLPEYRLYETALAALYSQRLETAVSLFHKILEMDSHNTLARYYLGETQLRAGRAGDAIREWETALNEDRGYTPAAQAIGEFWMARKEYAKARPYFDRVLAGNPNDYAAQFQLGVAEARLGNRVEAIEHLRAACKLIPDSAECERELNALK
ncbi:MAG TPA: sulfatase-like hydrolase/transferase [Bryobacteraceae bacterium]|nr:sulfatase-like hydrolase/transferase [Bryobacteraceae bacterium]